MVIVLLLSATLWAIACLIWLLWKCLYAGEEVHRQLKGRTGKP